MAKYSLNTEGPMIKQAFYIAGVCALLASCANGSEETRAGTIDAFFDLHAYLTELTDDYSQRKVRVNKTVTLNDNSELLENLEVDWKSEFQPLIQSHINRSAWQDKFRVDTTILEESYMVRYETDMLSIPVRNLEIEFASDGDVQSIRIETGRKNLLYSSKQVIEFIPDIRYHVKGSQRALFLSKTAFEVDSSILLEQDTDRANKGE